MLIYTSILFKIRKLTAIDEVSFYKVVGLSCRANGVGNIPLAEKPDLRTDNGSAFIYKVFGEYFEVK